MKGTKSIKRYRLVQYSWILIYGWTIIMVGMMYVGYMGHMSTVYDDARIVARVAYEKDVIYRRWNAMHGGVYVPETEVSPPNPYLTFVDERDITTPSGKKLTLMNPAYMTRQVHELQAQEYDILGHITSLNPIRPENVPDQWEAEALHAFEEGSTEISSMGILKGREYMRLMRPLVTEQGCLKCHAQQGYKVGDIRGGISVAVPLAPIRDIGYGRIYKMIIEFFFLWLLGLGVIFLGKKHQVNIEKELEKAEKEVEYYRNKKGQ